MNEVIKIIPAESGLSETKAQEVNAAFSIVLGKTAELEKEGNEVLKQELSEESCMDARAVRLKMVKVRTDTNKVHKALKANILLEGKAIDGLKNAQLCASKGMEEKLEEREKHYQRIEEHRIRQLNEEREAELRSYGCEVFPADLGKMDESVYGVYRDGMQAADEARKIKEEAEEKARLEEIEAKKAERAEAEKRRKAKEKKIKEENKRLKAEAELERARAEKLRPYMQFISDYDALMDLSEASLEAEIKILHKQAMEHVKAEAQKERDFEEAQQKLDADAKANAERDARAKDKAHREVITDGVFECLKGIGLSADDANNVVEAILAGKMPNVTINY